MWGESSCRFMLLSLCALTAPPTGRSRPFSDQPPYWEVFPELSSSAGHRITLEEVMQDHPEHLQLSLVVNGSHIQMELQQNRNLMPDTHTLTYYLPDGTQVTHTPQRDTCYYHGRVAGHSRPWSSFSLCSGLRGAVVVAPEQQYIVEPVPGDGRFRHRLRHVENIGNVTCETADALRISSGRTLLSLEAPRVDQGGQPLSHQSRRDVVSETKYVELVMVADNSEYKMLGGDLNALHTRMLEIANKMDAYYRELNVRVLLVGVEVWNQKDKIAVSAEPAQALNRFLSWRERELLPRVQHDNAQLLTSVRFKEPSVGMATMNSICTADRSGGVNRDHSVSVLGVASTMAHSLGHNLGLKHDTAERRCGQPSVGKQWIMENSSGFMPGLEFSKCSAQDLTASLQRGQGACLFNFPNPARVFGEPRCGNLLLERGEQCDCGLALECADPCCNASSCQLVAGADCASDGLCCEQCKLKPSGTLCREPLGECDLPEYCTGASAHCPANVYLQNGEPCARGRAHCYGGECRTLHSQCQGVWGPGSSPAPEVCFTHLNMRGDKYGNCGRRNGTYLPCTERHAQCGTLQCQGVPGSPDMVTVTVMLNGSEVSCRGFYLSPGEDVSEAALVRAGTPCAPGKVCVNQRCEDAADLMAHSCSTNCGGHGVCNSNNNCHCHPGWAPPDCGTSGQGGSTDSGPVGLEQASRSLATTLLIVLLLAALVLLLLCYVKRTFLRRKLAAIFTKSSQCQYRVTQSSSQPRPQRPPPPHWMQSTELQVMSAAHQSLCPVTMASLAFTLSPPITALRPVPLLASPAQSDPEDSDRPDPPSRPLPPDPVLKRQQVSVPGKPPPPPKKPLPVTPTLPRQDPSPAPPTYPERVTAPPSRHAPLPPYSGHTPRV